MNKPEIKIIKASSDTHVIEYKGVCLSVTVGGESYYHSDHGEPYNYEKDIKLLVDVVDKGIGPKTTREKIGTYDVEVFDACRSRDLHDANATLTAIGTSLNGIVPVLNANGFNIIPGEPGVVSLMYGDDVVTKLNIVGADPVNVVSKIMSDAMSYVKPARP